MVAVTEMPMAARTAKLLADRRYYELCDLAELKNASRSGAIGVEGSRQFKNFSEYMVPAQRFARLSKNQRNSGSLSIQIARSTCESSWPRWPVHAGQASAGASKSAES